jgi:hypothetical protein
MTEVEDETKMIVEVAIMVDDIEAVSVDKEVVHLQVLEQPVLYG